MLVFPQGKHEDEDDDHLATAKREFIEETADPSDLSRFLKDTDDTLAVWYKEAKMAVCFCEVPVEETLRAPPARLGRPLKPVWVEVSALRRVLAQPVSSKLDTGSGTHVLFPMTRKFLSTAQARLWMESDKTEMDQLLEKHAAQRAKDRGDVVPQQSAMQWSQPAADENKDNSWSAAAKSGDWNTGGQQDGGDDWWSKQKSSENAGRKPWSGAGAATGAAAIVEKFKIAIAERNTQSGNNDTWDNKNDKSSGQKHDRSDWGNWDEQGSKRQKVDDSAEEPMKLGAWRGAGTTERWSEWEKWESNEKPGKIMFRNTETNKITEDAPPATDE